MRRAVALLALLAALALWAAGPAAAQNISWWLGTAAAQTGSDQPAVQLPDYDAWADFARQVEAATEDSRATNLSLEQLRAQLVDWRERFLSAQRTNTTRIETIRAQIGVLGPVPAEGATEPEEIATRRKELEQELARLQAPGLTAEEAYRRADGLIREIDSILRERQADELLRLWPSPLNPANWPAGWGELRDTNKALWSEVERAWASEPRRAEAEANLPLILLYLAFAGVLILRGRAWMETLSQRMHQKATARGRDVWALVVSLGQIVLPAGGVYALVAAIRATGMVGLLGDVLVSTLPMVGLFVFTTIWLGGRIFPRDDRSDALLRLAPDRRAEGRLLVAAFGVVIGLDLLRRAVMDSGRSEAATAVLSFPVLVLAGIILFRLGQLLVLHTRNDATQGEPVSYRNRLILLVGRAAMAIGAVGPLLAAVGYVPAASAVVYPAILSLMLFGLLLIAQRFVGDLYALVTRGEDGARDALFPVVVGFLLLLAVLPVFALIWGARVADLEELWNRFREGFTFGQTRVSPSDFVVFTVVFVVGYALTRLVQGALQTSVLPKTSLDKGGQNAIVVGLGYLGIMLAALAAITAAGIDLSSLAIVAGALSVGIGFGLQNIVSNFVSGIILLIERPVSEGDWIEVGGVMGTVRGISVRSTRIQTFDRTDVIVPNSDLIAGRVTNWTRFNLNGRLIVTVGVAYGADTRKVERILQEIAEAQPLAVMNPPPTVLLTALAPESMNFEIRVILRDVNFIMPVRSEINHQIAERFAEEGIGISVAPRDVWPRPAAPASPMLTALAVLQDSEAIADDGTP
ncbi:DUF3772 domain-containing protein [Ruixingdingia sedimenti]|uniref:DUF3772 domain-containing protein n=1 Tax=Ruixingdingia sedimenti TaxID=3073604 RepID=A0ABU1FE81_9RHOB|nr:DUF3772 domain-containing protein [Xinfangfangia sp. LG-4]MDR5655197.1 DUF3772 domain-containing protein [Xinfangfangia sp. LG-4]